MGAKPLESEQVIIHIITVLLLVISITTDFKKNSLLSLSCLITVCVFVYACVCVCVCVCVYFYY